MALETSRAQTDPRLFAAAAQAAGPEPYHAMARSRFPGPGYREHLAALHESLCPAAYLEIGVFDGDTLALAGPGTLAIGVDPQPRPASARRYVAPTHVLRQTSDAFFAAEGSRLGAEGLRFDLVFIDGLHLFEQVLCDFIHAERLCHPGSVIVLHDTLPVAPVTAARQRETSYWCGDVWKIVPFLRCHRPDLSMLHLPTFPSGLTVVTGLDPESRSLAEQPGPTVAAWIERELTEADIAAMAAQASRNDPASMVARVEAALAQAGRGGPAAGSPARDA